MQKSKTWPIDIPDISPYYFGLFYEWMSDREWLPRKVKEDVMLEFDFETLARPWLLGHEYEAPMFQNAIMDIMIDNALWKRLAYFADVDRFVSESPEHDLLLARFVHAIYPHVM